MHKTRALLGRSSRLFQSNAAKGHGYQAQMARNRAREQDSWGTVWGKGGKGGPLLDSGTGQLRPAMPRSSAQGHQQNCISCLIAWGIAVKIREARAPPTLLKHRSRLNSAFRPKLPLEVVECIAVSQWLRELVASPSCSRQLTRKVPLSDVIHSL